MKEYIAPGFVIPSGYTKELALESVGKGWASLIEIAFAAKPDDIKIVQVKEKFGTLRIYAEPYRVSYQALISFLEGASRYMCELDGKLGTLDTQRSWMVTLCLEHIKERMSV
jgi:hypothetical protein